MDNRGQKPKGEEKQDRSFSVPSSEVGRGAGLDPQSQPVRDDGRPEDEAFHDRPSVKNERGGDDEGASIQRPPADS